VVAVSFPDLGRDRVNPVRTSTRDDDVGASLRESHCQDAADAAGTTYDNGRTAAQIEHRHQWDACRRRERARLGREPAVVSTCGGAISGSCD